MSADFKSRQSMIEDATLRMIHEAIERDKEEIIQAAVRDFEVKIRSEVGRVVIALTNYFAIERQGNEMVIRVKIEKGESQ